MSTTQSGGMREREKGQERERDRERRERERIYGYGRSEATKGCVATHGLRCEWARASERETERGACIGAHCCDLTFWLLVGLAVASSGTVARRGVVPRSAALAI